MVYYTIKCPNCEQVVERGKDRTTQYGSPFRKCRHCGHIYVDTNYIEPGLYDEKDLFKKKFSLGGPFFVIFGLFCLYGWWSSQVIFIGFVGLCTLVLGIASIVSCLKYRPQEDNRLLRDFQESKERLSDPHYVIALWKAECHVTPEILAWAKNAIASEENESNVNT